MTSHQILLIIFAVIALYAVITGFMKGLLSQIGQIAGLIIGVLASRALTPGLLLMLSADADTEPASMFTTVLCYILVYLAAYFSVVLVARLLKLVVKVVCLGIIDRLAGAVFKLLKWLLVMSLAYNLLVTAYPASAPGKTAGFVERTVYDFAPAVLDMWRWEKQAQAQ